jgi:hypothetical protein
MKEWMIERNPCAPDIHVATPAKVNLTELQKPHVVFAVEREEYDKLVEKLNTYARALVLCGVVDVEEVITRNPLAEENETLKEFFLDMLGQGCGRYNREKDIMEYDHMCLSTWESATSYAVERGWIKKKQVTR